MGVEWQRPPRFAGVPSWILSIPFLGLHLAGLAILFTAVTPVALILMGVTYLVRMFGITGVYHRYFSHRSYKTSRLVQFLLAFLACSALQKGPLWWAAHHRRHHRYSDGPDDPHSPHRTSFWWAHVGWLMSERHDAIRWEEVRDWARYPELRWLDRNHWVPGVMLAVLCFLIGGWAGLAWGFVVSTILCYHATFAINSLSHIVGRRRYDTDDESRNNLVLAVVTLGEGWHNNHHHYQSSANQGFYWWEIDITFLMLRLLALFGLVWDLRRPGAKVLNYRLIRTRRRLPPEPQPLEETASAANSASRSEGGAQPVTSNPEPPPAVPVEAG